MGPGLTVACCAPALRQLLQSQIQMSSYNTALSHPCRSCQTSRNSRCSSDWFPIPSGPWGSLYRPEMYYFIPLTAKYEVIKHKSIAMQSASHTPLSTTNLLTEFSDLFQTKKGKVYRFWNNDFQPWNIDFRCRSHWHLLQDLKVIYFFN